MSQFLTNLTGEGGLFRVRSVATLALVGGFVWGFVDGIISADLYVPVLTIAITFYFTVRAVQAGVTVTNGK